MELDAVKPSFLVGHGRHRTVDGVGDHGKSLGRAGHLKGVTHPTDAFGLHALEQAALGGIHGNRRPSILPLLSALDGSAHEMGHELHAIADAQNRHAQREHRRINPGRALFQHAGRPAGKDNAPGIFLANLLYTGRIRQHAGIDPALADAPGNELGILAAKVKNQNASHLFFHSIDPFPAINCRCEWVVQICVCSAPPEPRWDSCR